MTPEEIQAVATLAAGKVIAFLVWAALAAVAIVALGDVLGIKQ